MRTKRHSFIPITVICLFIVSGYSFDRAEAGSPWQWDKVLKHEKVADAMIMPSSLFIDSEKELYYVVDSGRNRLLSFSRKGELRSILNAGKALKLPSDMVKMHSPGLWVIEKGRNSLSYINLKDKTVTPNTLHYRGKLVYPDRVETDSDQLYILNKATGNIIRYTKNLKPVTRYSCSDCPWGFVDFKIHQQNIWALDQAGKTIRRFTMKGDLIATINLGDSVNFPVSLAIGPSNFIYVLDRQRRNIAVYDRNGIFKYRFLKKGIARGQLNYPSEIRFDPWGGLCLVDEGNARVEIFKR